MSGRRGSPSGSLANLPANVWFIGQESPIAQRRGRYVPASVRGHPGKMLPELARRLVESYTKPGEWVLDPMSGIGTIGVEAIARGRHYVGIELEPRFVAWQRENLEQARVRGATGSVTVLQEDARRLDSMYPDRLGAPGLAAIPRPQQWVDTVLTSPPYGVRLGQRSPGAHSPFVRCLIRRGACKPGFLPGVYGRGRCNIGNLAGAAQLQAMQHVYAGCFEVLRPGGLLVVVLRPGRDKQRLQPLHHDTVRLCQDIGFDFIDEVVAFFGRVVAVPGEPVAVHNHAHFWRRLAAARLRAAGWSITLEQTEYVLVLQKPDRPRSAEHETGATRRPLLPAPSLANRWVYRCDLVREVSAVNSP